MSSRRRSTFGRRVAKLCTDVARRRELFRLVRSCLELRRVARTELGGVGPSRGMSKFRAVLVVLVAGTAGCGSESGAVDPNEPVGAAGNAAGGSGSPSAIAP